MSRVLAKMFVRKQTSHRNKQLKCQTPDSPFYFYLVKEVESLFIRLELLLFFYTSICAST